MVTSPVGQIREARFVKALPILGNIIPFNRDRLQFLGDISRKQEDAVGFHVGPVPVILFHTPEAVQEILVNKEHCFNKGHFAYTVFRPTLGNGLLISEGTEHRRNRKVMAPYFQPKHIISYAESMIHYSELIQQQWKDGDIIKAGYQMSALTMSIIGKLLFDTDMFTETDTLAEAMSLITNHHSTLLANPIYPPLNWPTPYNNKVRKALRIIEDRLLQMIVERRNNPSERNDLLSRLLQAQDDDGNTMDDQQMLDECKTLFAAGHVTTASVATWMWYSLCNNPKIYELVQREVDSVLQGNTPTYADIARLPYCLQVVKETLRLYPPAYVTGRESIQEVEICGVKVPKAHQVWVSHYHMHRTPKYFPEPDSFHPDRFLPEQEKQIPRNVYFPFGTGPRVCIGNHLAMMELHLLLATLSQRVTFELLPGQNIKPDLTKKLTLCPGGKVLLRVKRR